MLLTFLLLMLLIYGFAMGMFFSLCLIHKKIYGSWIPKKENLPLSIKIKERIEKKV